MVVLFSIFLMINDVEHVFMNPLATCVSSLEKYPHPLYILKSGGFAVVFLFGFFCLFYFFYILGLSSFVCC